MKSLFSLEEIIVRKIPVQLTSSFRLHRIPNIAIEIVVARQQ